MKNLASVFCAAALRWLAATVSGRVREHDDCGFSRGQPDPLSSDDGTTDDMRSVWTAATGLGPNGMYALPGLVNAGHGGTIGDSAKLPTPRAYKLTASSPLVTVGANPSATV